MFYSDCVSMDQEIFNSENITLVETIENPYPEYCPVWNFQLKEEEEKFNSHLVHVKKEEKEIFAMWRDGFSYSEIAQKVSCEMKYVDNVIQKIRKIRNKHMNNELIV